MVVGSLINALGLVLFLLGLRRDEYQIYLMAVSGFCFAVGTSCVFWGFVWSYYRLQVY